MEHHLKMMLEGKIMTLEVYSYSRHGILQMGPLTYVVAIGSPEWQLRESHSLKKPSSADLRTLLTSHDTGLTRQ